MSIALPKGVKDFLPEKAARMRSIEKELFNTFQLWGYREVRTPLIEYLDTLALGEPDLLQQMIKFEDRASGKVLSLRPDITAQIARLAAKHLKDHPKPLRINYQGAVLHYGDNDAGMRREIYQSGLELIGLDQPEADGEVIAVAIEAIRSTGLEDFKIDVGQVDFFRSVLAGMDLSANKMSDIEEAISRKDRSGLEELLPSLDLTKKDEEILLALPTLFGDRNVVERARGMTDDVRAQAALENLDQVLDVLDSYDLMEYIIVDLGEIRRLNYYTGIIFEGFVTGMGEEICGGGRYDALVGLYGHKTPATGFAIDIEGLLKAIEGQGKVQDASFADLLLVNRGAELKPALQLSRQLRSKGLKVARAILERNDDETVAYAKSESIRKIVFIGADGAAEDEVIVLDVQSEARRVCSIDDLVVGAL